MTKGTVTAVTNLSSRKDNVPFPGVLGTKLLPVGPGALAPTLPLWPAAYETGPVLPVLAVTSDLWHEMR